MTHRFKHIHPIALAAALAGATLASPALAIRDAIPITPGLVIANPYNPGQTVDAWKLVGWGLCSAFRISREWIMNSGHCSYPATFTSAQGTASVQSCSNLDTDFGYNASSKANDFQVCRLSNPEALTNDVAYPPLAVMPAFNVNNAGKFGALMLAGWARFAETDPHQVALVDLNGIPPGVSAATLDLTQNVPYFISGDSGGGVYWLPPNGQPPALVGVISTPNYGHPGGLTAIPWYLTSANLTALSSYIASHSLPGEQQPVFVTSPTGYFSVPAADPALPLAGAPLVKAINGSASNVSVSWSPPPSGGPTVNRYKITLAQNGTLTGNASLPAWMELTTSFSGLTPSAGNVVCVRPVNDAGGSATAAYALGVMASPSYAKATRLGCATFDSRTPSAIANLQLTATSTPGSSLASIKATWNIQAAPTALYRVTRTIWYSPTIQRSQPVQYVMGNAYAAPAAKGIKQCVRVQALSAIQAEGPADEKCMTP